MYSWFFKPTATTGADAGSSASAAAAEEPASAAAAETPVVAADAASISVIERLNQQLYGLSELGLNAKKLKRITSQFNKLAEQNSTAVLWVDVSCLKKIPDENWARFHESVKKHEASSMAFNILKQARNPEVSKPQAKERLEEGLEDWCSIEPDEGSSPPAPNLPGM
jgi:hypothetical protein